MTIGGRSHGYGPADGQSVEGSRMHVVRRAAFAFTALCLVLAVVTMLGSTTLTFTAGSASTVDCGSAAFPKSSDDFDSADDAANCAGQTSASVALYCVLLAGLGLGVIAATSRSTSASRDGERPPARQASHSSPST